MRHSDLVINVCSTITLDASVSDRPVICYRCLDAYTDKEKMRKMIEAHDADHFRPLIEVDGLSVAETNDQLKSLVDKYLKDPKIHKEKREAATALMVPYRDGSMARRLGELLLEILDDTVSSPTDRQLGL